MEITLSAVTEAARLRRAGVTAEVAGYVVLLAVQELSRAPRRVSADGLFLTESGEMRVASSYVSGAGTPEIEVEADLRQLLASLTSLAQSVSPALKIATERASVGRLSALEAELMAALIPINHAAARRALARLYREAHKSRIESLSVAAESGTLTPSPAASSVVVRAPTPSPAPVSVSAPPAPTPAPPRARIPLPRAFASEARPRAPAIRAFTPSIEAPPPGGDLDIDVEVEGLEQEPPASRGGAGTPAPASAAPLAVSPARESEYEPVSHRSDLRELLAGFLSHTRCDEQMTADLRRMIGLDAPPLPPSVAPPPVLGVPPRAP